MKMDFVYPKINCMSLLFVSLSVSTIGFAFVLGLGFVETIKLLLWVVFIDCVGVGLLIATLMWYVPLK